MKAYPTKIIKQAQKKRSPEELFQERLKNLKFRKKYNQLLSDCLQFMERNKDLKKWVQSKIGEPYRASLLDWNGILYDQVSYTEEELVEMFNKQHFKKDKVRFKDVKKMRLLKE